MHAASDKNAVIGTWATTSRAQDQRSRDAISFSAQAGRWAQVQRLGNPLINELIIGTGSKDTLQHGRIRRTTRNSPASF